MSDLRCAKLEWPTLAMLGLTYAVWGLGTTWASALWLPLGMVLVALSAAQHSSLCHEALHGHPTRIRLINEALVFPQLSLFIPYARFRDTHLTHHEDENLTDPYDDPESNYRDPAAWARYPRWLRAVFNFNNTLFGRMLIGPLIGQVFFMADDWRLIRAGDKTVLRAWALHVPALGLVLWWVAAVGQMPWWAFVASSYAGLSLLKIRTYLEHRAHEEVDGRTVVIEDKGLLALLFLNNNYHAVHHARPGVPWYQLPRVFETERNAVIERNEHYYYRTYREIFARYFLRAKDPVPHPLWPKE